MPSARGTAPRGRVPRGYGQFCPIAKSLQVLGGRWTLLIVRDMLLGGAERFNELANGLPRLSRGVLSERLRQLQRAGIVARSDDAPDGRPSYRLTQAGRELRPVIEALLAWGAAWAFDDPDEDDLDPVLLMWWVRGGVATDRLPDRRTVVEFAFRGVDRRFWLVLDATDASLCLQRPRFDVDVRVDADLAAFFDVWLGRRPYRDATEAGAIVVDADPELAQAFPDWFDGSPTAAAMRAARNARSSPRG